jgi:hypothetical protein
MAHVQSGFCLEMRVTQKASCIHIQENGEKGMGITVVRHVMLPDEGIAYLNTNLFLTFKAIINPSKPVGSNTGEGYTDPFQLV